MKLTLRDLIKFSLVLISSATPTLAQQSLSQQEINRNPFLPKNSTTEIVPTIPWPRTTKTITGNPFLTTGNPFLTKKTTTTAKPANNGTQTQRLPTVQEGCGRNFNFGYTRAYRNGGELGENRKSISGGTQARKHDWPFIALLGYGDGSYKTFKCGGTLITARHVITAAHCIQDDLTFVRLGEHDLNINMDTLHVDIPIVKIARHPDYSPRNGRSDIAILYLEWSVEFNTQILPICMPSSSSLRSKSYVDSNATIAGWGRLKEGGETATVLNELKIPVLKNEVCRSSYARVNRHFTDDQFDQAVVCAGFLTGGKDSCNGDSGGPLIISEDVTDEYPKERYFLIGIVAYGVGCARPGIPGVYTSTQYFIDWIQEKLNDTSQL